MRIPFANSISAWWVSLNFRTQLVISHGGLITVSLVLLGLTLHLLAEKILMDRGFSLLESTNRLSVARFLERMDSLSNREADCDPSARQDWKEIKESPHFLRELSVGVGMNTAGVAIVTEPSGEMVLRIASPCAEFGDAVLHTAWLSSLFNDRTGLGASGETYMIAENGKLITESRFLEKPAPAPIPADLGQHWRGIKNDYRGIPVLASWTRVSLDNFQGVIASEIDEAEVREPIRKLVYAGLVVLLFVFAATALVIPYFAQALSRNLERIKELEQVKNLAIIEGQERERVRLSLELHDDIGQRLTALGWRVSASSVKEDEKGLLVGNVRQLAQQVRTLSGDLSNLLVQEVGLAKAVLQLLEDAQVAGNLNFELDVTGEFENAADPAKSTAVYRVAQEALANILKHSGASSAKYSLSISPSGLGLIVEDNGVGFDEAEKRAGKGLGLRNMRVRAEAFGGSFHVSRAYPQGTRIEVNIPLEGVRA